MRRYRGYLKRKGLKDSSIKAYERRVSQFLQWTTEKGIIIKKTRYNDVIAYIAMQKKRGLTARSINQDQVAIRYYFESLGVKNNPATDIKVKGTPRSIPQNLLSEEQLQHLYESTDAGTPYRLRDKVMLGLFLFQGTSAGDVEAMKLKDVDVRSGKVTLTKKHKSNERILLLHPQQIIDFHTYIESARQQLNAKREIPSELLFFSSSSSSKLHNTLQRLANRLKKQHSIFSDYYQLRASVISNWMKEHNLREVQYRAGHRYVSSTERYQRGDVSELQELLKGFDPMQNRIP
jgi:integrase/recombinase XerD